MVNRVKPVLQALVLADHVYEDKTGKKIIAGTFHGIKFSRKPPITEVVLPDGSKKLTVAGGMQSGSPYAYLSLTDVCTNTVLSVQFIYLTKNIVIFNMDLRIECDNRLGTVEIVLPLPKLPIQEAGTYALEVICEGEIIGSSRITAEDITPT
jgi:hypothetical protein